MRYLVFVTVVFACTFAERVASAQTFGGFAADDSAYLVGRDQVCRPLAQGAGSQAPACERKSTGEVAAMKFRRGIKQAGPRAAYQAEARGTSLILRALEGGTGVAEVGSFTSIDPIARVVDVYLSERGTLVAVEYEVRFAGSTRREVVAFVLPAQAGQSAQKRPAGDPAPATAPTAPATTQPTAGTTESPTSPELDKALAKARGLDKQGRTQPALAAYRSALAIDPQSSEAHYGVARQLAKQKKLAEAVAAIEAIAGSQRSDAGIWLVEARFDNAFAALRSDARFRKASGLDPTPGRERSLYERLLGFSNTWEQPEIKCEQAEIHLTFARLARTFELKVISRCGGYKDVQTMRGRFALAGQSRIDLTLPNKGGSDEAISCEMKTCTGEDCLYCMLDRDLEMVLRVVRR